MTYPKVDDNVVLRKGNTRIEGRVTQVSVGNYAPTIHWVHIDGILEPNAFRFCDWEVTVIVPEPTVVGSLITAGRDKRTLYVRTLDNHSYRWLGIAGDLAGHRFEFDLLTDPKIIYSAKPADFPL